MWRCQLLNALKPQRHRCVQNFWSRSLTQHLLETTPFSRPAEEHSLGSLHATIWSSGGSHWHAAGGRIRFSRAQRLTSGAGVWQWHRAPGECIAALWGRLDHRPHFWSGKRVREGHKAWRDCDVEGHWAIGILALKRDGLSRDPEILGWFKGSKDHQLCGVIGNPCKPCFSEGAHTFTKTNFWLQEISGGLDP